MPDQASTGSQTVMQVAVAVNSTGPTSSFVQSDTSPLTVSS